MQRPGTVTTFGILNIVFGAWSVLGTLVAIAIQSSKLMESNPAMKMLNEQPVYAAWMKISLPLAIVTGAALIAAGIGLLMLKNWGRILSIIYGVYAIVAAIIGLLISILFVVRPLLQNLSANDPKSAGAIGAVIGTVIGGFFALIYPSLLIFFMTRRSVAIAFEPEQPPPVPIG